VGFRWDFVPPYVALKQRHTAVAAGSQFCIWLALGVTLSMLGVTSTSTWPKTQEKPPNTILAKSGLVQTSSKWPSEV